MVATEAVEKFLRENEVDDRAAAALRNADPETQAAAMERGNLTDCTNASAALMARIRGSAGSGNQSGLSKADLEGDPKDVWARICARNNIDVSRATTVAPSASVSAQTQQQIAIQQQMAAQQQMALLQQQMAVQQQMAYVQQQQQLLEYQRLQQISAQQMAAQQQLATQQQMVGQILPGGGAVASGCIPGAAQPQMVAQQPMIDQTLPGVGANTVGYGPELAASVASTSAAPLNAQPAACHAQQLSLGGSVGLAACTLPGVGDPASINTAGGVCFSALDNVALGVPAAGVVPGGSGIPESNATGVSYPTSSVTTGSAGCLDSSATGISNPASSDIEVGAVFPTTGGIASNGIMYPSDALRLDMSSSFSPTLAESAPIAKAGGTGVRFSPY